MNLEIVKSLLSFIAQLFSSRGPAFDGRIKPELVAYSTIGTSNSAAIVTGVTALLQQQYKLLYSHLPLASLLKALLINSAKDVGNPGPDHLTGYGSVDAYKALSAILKGNFIIDRISQSETKSYTINVPSNTKDLKVSLVWTDTPAAANSNIALINDLDLIVKDAGNTNWMPWVLKKSASVSDLNENAVRGTDHLNNIEQVSINILSEGNYTIEVNAYNITSSNQQFSIVYDWNQSDKFEWYSPTRSDAISYYASTVIPIKWESTFDTLSGSLEISFNNGNSWQTTDNQVDLAKGTYLWAPDSEINSAAVLKMKIEENDFISDTFVLVNNTNIRVSLNCDKTVELAWNESSNANHYLVYNFNKGNMQVVEQTNNLSYAFNNDDYNTSIFSVQAVFENNKFGQRSEVADYAIIEESCYINSVYALNLPDKEAIEITVDLGSLYLINSIEIYSLVNGNKTLLETILNPEKLSNSYIDYDPKEGQNKYHIKVILSNGSEYESEVFEVFYLSENPFCIFPNPVARTGVNVYTKNFNENTINFELYNIHGKLILTRKFNSDRNYVELNGIKPGIYIK